MSGRLYHLEARDTSGVFLGMAAGELVLAGSGATVAIVMHLGGAPVVVSAVPLGVGFALAKLRLRGTPLREWARLLALWTTSRLRWRHRWQAPLPLFGACGMPTAELPTAIADVDVIEVATGARPLAAVRDRAAGRVTAVLSVTGPQFGGLDPPAQDALLAAWGDALGANATAASPVAQIGWSDSAAPSDLADHRMWASERLATAGDAQSYEELVCDVSAVALVHETVVWITVDGSQVHDAGGKPAERAAQHLPLAVEDLTAALHGAGLRTAGPLPAAGLWRLLRSRIDPADAALRSNGHAASLAERLGLVGQHNAGPLVMSTNWSELRIDGSWHRTYWIETWPRRPQPGDWLSGFLASGEPHTMTVAFRPIDPARSQRRIDSQLSKHAANRIRKQEKERRVTEADHRTEAAVYELEAELASGHAELLYLGLVTASAPTLDELDSRCRRLEQKARAGGMGLRVLHARQDAAWAASLPFGLAEPGLFDLIGI